MHSFKNSKTAMDFMFAGRALLTARSEKTGDHFTFRIKKSRDGKIWFVSLLGGSEERYTYLGWIKPTVAFELSQKSKIDRTSKAPTAFGWIFKHLMAGSMPPNTELKHEGKCGRCGRALTHPESIETGFGPECVKTAKKGTLL